MRMPRAVINSNGIPHLFLTLTADEVSGTRWPEVAAMEQRVQHMTELQGLTWQDMPCEMAHMFSDRVITGQPSVWHAIVTR